MPGISIAKLREDIRPIRIQFGSDVLRCEVYPHRFTNELMDRYRDAQDDPKDYDEIAAVLGELIRSWDLVYNEGDEEPIPFTGEAIREQVSLSVLNHVITEIAEALAPKSKKRSGN